MKLEQVLGPTTVSRRVKYRVTLTAEERAELDQLIRTGTGAARKLAHARILLKADEPPDGPGWTDEQIAVAVDVSVNTVARVRERFVEEGVTAALTPKPSAWRPPRTLDGRQEAHLLALLCGPPPAGQVRWTLRLLRDRFVALEDVGVPVSHETIRQVLKKTSSSRGKAKNIAFPRRRTASL